MKALELHHGTKDLSFDGHRDLRMVDGLDEIAQALRLRLQTRRGEWFLNTEFGLDYGVILGQKAPDLFRVRSEVARTILEEPRVQEIETLSLQFDERERHLTVDFEVRVENADLLRDEVILSV